MKTRKWVNFSVSLLVGFGIFLFFLFRIGFGTILSVLEEFNYFYLAIFFLVSIFGFLFISFRIKSILKAHGKDVGVFRLLRQSIAGFSVSYLTPVEMLGGEPVRVFMLKKECGVDYKTGTSAVILDKFMDVLGSLVFIIAEIGLLFYFIAISFFYKSLIAISFILFLFVFLVFYFRTVNGKGSFSSVCKFFKIHRLSKKKDIILELKDVELRMSDFFNNHKSQFLSAFIWDFLYGIFLIVQMKILFLGLGIDAGLVVILFSLAILAFSNLIPIPAGFGVLEGSEESLLSLFFREGFGFVLGFMIRIRDLFFAMIGLIITFGFSRDCFFKK